MNVMKKMEIAGCVVMGHAVCGEKRDEASPATKSI